MFGIGAGEFVIILIAGLILFGPSKLPEVGRALGKAIKEFRKAQAALTASLEESAEPVKKTPPPSENKISVDDVINLAKKNPIAEENVHEKNSATANDISVADTSSGDVVARSNSDSIKK